MKPELKEAVERLRRADDVLVVNGPMDSSIVSIGGMMDSDFAHQLAQDLNAILTAVLSGEYVHKSELEGLVNSFRSQQERPNIGIVYQACADEIESLTGGDPTTE